MSSALTQQIEHHLEFIYRDTEVDNTGNLAAELIQLMRLENIEPIKNRYINHWDEKDSILICYGDSVLEPERHPLASLKSFLDSYSKDMIDGVHILPFSSQ